MPYLQKVFMLVGSVALVSAMTNLSAISKEESTSSAASGNEVSQKNLPVMKTFKHGEIEFSIDYPEGWEVPDFGSPYLLKAKDPNRKANLNAAVEQALGSSKDFAQRTAEFMAKNPDDHYQIVSTEDTTICGEKSVKRIQTMGDGKDFIAKQMSIYVVKNNISYVVNCTCTAESYPEYEPVFNKIIESIKI
ncbi:MAG: hypothetical protein KIT34_09930 [Cyanobacteria bacterium TGS_CYA1]|nr:hypothetical protein [Cyanobacteria bacterium TGS_CYA1]